MKEDRFECFAVFLLWLAIVVCLFRVASCAEESNHELRQHFQEHHNMENR